MKEEIYNAFFTYAERVLCPDNAYESRFNKRDPKQPFLLKTIDGVVVKAEFITTWKNDDGRFDENLNDVAQRYWHCTFEQVKSLWVARLGKVGNYWDLIRLEKVERND